jgi:ubiquitin-small subunit ribosomal protein S27Ae
MQIFVGSTAYEVDSGLSVESLKAQIENREFVPANQIRLTVNGKVLEFGTLEGNGVEDEDEVALALEVNAGMRKKWRKKRMRRLRRKRRKMRQRAR